jgi:hypothetical protein
VILEFTLNSRSRPTYGPFTNEILLFPLAILLIFSPRSNKSATTISNKQSSQQQATIVTTTGNNRHSNRQQSSVTIHKLHSNSRHHKHHRWNHSSNTEAMVALGDLRRH